MSVTLWRRRRSVRVDKIDIERVVSVQSSYSVVVIRPGEFAMDSGMVQRMKADFAHSRNGVAVKTTPEFCGRRVPPPVDLSRLGGKLGVAGRCSVRMRNL